MFHFSKWGPQVTESCQAVKTLTRNLCARTPRPGLLDHSRWRNYPRIVSTTFRFATRCNATELPWIRLIWCQPQVKAIVNASVGSRPFVFVSSLGNWSTRPMQWLKSNYFAMSWNQRLFLFITVFPLDIVVGEWCLSDRILSPSIEVSPDVTVNILSLNLRLAN